MLLSASYVLHMLQPRLQLESLDFLLPGLDSEKFHPGSWRSCGGLKMCCLYVLAGPGVFWLL